MTEGGWAGCVTSVFGRSSKFKMAAEKSDDSDQMVEVSEEVNCSTLTGRFSKALTFNMWVVLLGNFK